MSSLLDACRAWLRDTLGWSDSAESWQERGGGAALLTAAVVLVWCARLLPLPVQVAVWALMLIAIAVLMRRGLFKLFGPVLFYDMLQVGRRSRYIILRLLYTLGLSLILILVWAKWEEEYDWTGVPANRMNEFTESFFF